MKDLRYAVALSLAPKTGAVSFKHAVEQLGSARAALEAGEAEWRRALRAVKGAKAPWPGLAAASLLEKAELEIEKAQKAGVDVIALGDPRYPAALREIYDPPAVLYVKGSLPSADMPSVAVVGSRVASLYGRTMAEKISREVAAAGVTVVSGLALGIDTAAHEGALAGGGKTIAVLGGGIGRLYPPQNKRLAEKIAASGAVISEYPMDMEAQPGFFPMRNRVISGLSQAVLVIEARQKSGALITADLALEQGRDVLALPGNADSSKSMGTNSLLKQGAKLVVSAADVLAELGFSAVKKAKESRRKSLSAEEERVASLLEDGPLHLDEIAESSQFSLQKSLSVLSYLEMKGVVKETPGKYFRKA